MLIVKQDKTRKEEEGQIFVELTIYRDVRNIADCNRLGYWCDKAHLSHFIMECAKCFTQDELKNILKMNGNNIYIEKNNLLDAYKNGNADNKKMLENLFGKEMFRPKNIMERIKTFDDAFKELGENHPLVKEYHKRHLFLEDDSDISSDLVAYLKLRIITAALNEGWTPQFTKDEYRYYPWFWLYTKEEIEARAEIHIENYTTVLTIEARTMADMLRRQILPAVSAVTAELCERGWKKEQMGVSHKADDAVAREMGQLTDKLYAATEKMERDLSKIPADAKKAMAYSHDHLIPDMEKARELADRLEELTPAERWPFPVYSDLLFSV